MNDADSDRIKRELERAAIELVNELFNFRPNISDLEVLLGPLNIFVFWNTKSNVPHHELLGGKITGYRFEQLASQDTLTLYVELPNFLDTYKIKSISLNRKSGSRLNIEHLPSDVTNLGCNFNLVRTKIKIG